VCKTREESAEPERPWEQGEHGEHAAVSLRWRMTTAMALLVLLVVAAAGFAAHSVVARQLRYETDQALLRRGVVRDGGPSRGRRGPPGLDGPALDTLRAAGRRPNVCLGGRRGESVIVVQVISRDGTVDRCESEFALPTDAKDLALAKQAGPPRLRTVTVKTEGKTERYRLLTISTPQGAAQVARELDTETRVLAGLIKRFALLGLLATLISAIVGWFLARRMVRPVEQLRNATDRITKTQQLDTIPTFKGNDEVASLARSFNAMVSALVTSREQQHRLIADASHELRTPLTSLRTNIELANRSRPLDAEQLRVVLSAALSEVGELTNLTEELVELATDRTVDEPQQEIDLITVANDVVTRTQRRTGRTITIDTRADLGTVPFVGRPRMIERAMTNLVENAVKYAPVPASIALIISGNDAEAEVSVRDSGPGIAESDLPHVFDRFYRADLARTTPGSGLGLAIVQQVAERHAGKVFARNNIDGGATVGFTLAAGLSQDDH
jgi:two-component system, OmpR family, sensor histidine kinase MprB